MLGCILVSAGCSSLASRSAPAQFISTPPPGSPPASPSGIPFSAANPCQGAVAPATYEHVVWVVMENHSYSDVLGRAGSYLGQLAGQCGNATAFSAESHPSLPNYIAMTSGGTQQVADDAGPGAHRLTARSLFAQLGPDWRSLQESMPSNCARGDSGEYAVKHNPAVYYLDVAGLCAGQDVALGSVADVSARFTFITPNLCHDTHDCSVAAGDQWLSSVVPMMLNSPQYAAGGMAIVVTFDEDDGSGANRIPTVVIAPSVPTGTVVTTALDHYSLLRTTEEMLGLPAFLGAAAAAPSMRGPFHL